MCIDLNMYFNLIIKDMNIDMLPKCRMPNAKGRMQQDQSLLLDLIDLVSYLLSFPFIIFHLMVC